MGPKRLTLFAPNLSGGGAERTLARLATHWCHIGCDVTLITIADVSPDDFPVPAGVHRVALGLASDSRGAFGATRSNLRRIAKLRAALREARPHVVVSFIEQANVLALLAARPLKVPVVISERTDPSLHQIGRAWDFLRRRLYHRCAALVVLTEDIKSFLLPIVRGKAVFVIPNGVRQVEHLPTHERSKERILLAVGRLDPAKGFDRLIAAFSRVAINVLPTWKLVILGEGPARGELESFAARLPAGSVSLPGRVKDPENWMARADLFALPSRYEGFPNALLEAMAHGLTAVAFDGPAAVRGIIRHEVDGLLVADGDIDAFGSALQLLMSDDALRSRLAASAPDVSRRFSIGKFYDRWDHAVTYAQYGGLGPQHEPQFPTYR